MTTKHTPAMPLPFSVDEQKYQIRIVGSKRNKTIAMTGRIDDETRQQFAYIAHAANAYPLLVEALKGWLESHNNNEYPGGANVRAILTDSLLREFGEE